MGESWAWWTVAKAEVAPALKICSGAEIKDTDLKVFCDPEFITGGALCLRVSKWLRREAWRGG